MVYEMDRVFSHDIPKLLEKASHGGGGGGGGGGGWREGGRA